MSWSYDKQNAIWTMGGYVVSEWEDAIFFPDETAWHDVGLSVENCKLVCEWHARIAALEAQLAASEARAREAERESDKWRARCANAVFLIPDNVLCGDIRKQAESFTEELTAAKSRADAAEAKLAAVRADPASLLPDMVWERYEYEFVVFRMVEEWRCVTPVGTFQARSYSGRSEWAVLGVAGPFDCASLEAAKAACDQDRRERARRLFQG